MAELELHGYLTTGKFYVNDYTINIRKVSEGMNMEIIDGNTGRVQSVTVRDGEPGLTPSEVETIKNLYELMRESNQMWTDAEAARAAAEDERTAAEAVRAAADDGRQALWQRVKELYELLYDPETGELRSADDVRRAEAAAERAEAAARSATFIGIGTISDMLFYMNGVRLIFKDESSEPELGISSDAKCTSLNASGYVTEDGKKIHVKIPLAKRMDYVSGVTIVNFEANIANSGGYGKTRKYVAAGSDYKPDIKSVIVDKVQNCLHIVFYNANGYNLNNNDTISCRCKNIIIDLTVEVPNS